MPNIDAAMVGPLQAVPPVETLLCHLLIVRHNDSEVLLHKNGEYHSLPRIEIPRWRRIAPYLVPAVTKQLGIEAVCRLSFEGAERYVLLDPLDESGVGASGLVWTSIHKIHWSESEIDLTRDFHTALQRATFQSASDPPVPFSGPRWFEEIQDWVESHLRRHGVTLSGRWLQYNIGPWFSLLRFETDALPVWFKAVGAPNLREYAITLELAKLSSKHLPLLIASEPRWHGWLMSEAAGKPLDEKVDLNGWKIVARSLATLQIQSIPENELLLAAGCGDLRAEALRLQIRPFLQVAEQLMTMQPSTPPPILQRLELQWIEDQLQNAIGELQSAAMPDAINHLDLNAGNILVARHGATFLDWMEGCIAHPFLTFEYLSVLLNRLRPGYESWQGVLREAYCDPWRHLYSETQIVHMLQRAPLIAPYALAINIVGSEHDGRNISPNLQKLLRSLTRRMFAAAQRIAAPRSTRF